MIVAIHKTNGTEKRFSSIKSLLKFLKKHKSYGGWYRLPDGHLKIIRQFPEL